MPCIRICKSRTDQPVNDYGETTLAIFFTVYYILRNFIDLLKFRGPKYKNIGYDEIPLQGALDIAASGIKSIYRENIPRGELKQQGLFYDIFSFSKRCQEMQIIPENTIRKVDVILSCLEKSYSVEKLSSQIREILINLEELPPNVISDRLQMLYFLLKEITQNFVSYGQVVKKHLSDRERKVVMNLTNEFIRSLSEKRSSSQPCVKVCRFCDQIINEMRRQLGTFCCKDAQHLNHIWKEYTLKQDISKSVEFNKQVSENDCPSHKYVDIIEEPLDLHKIDKQSNTTSCFPESTAYCTGQEHHVNLDTVVTEVHEDRHTRRIVDCKKQFDVCYSAIKRPDIHDTCTTTYPEEVEEGPMKIEIECPAKRVDRKSDKFDDIEGRDLTGKRLDSFRSVDNSSREEKKADKPHLRKRSKYLEASDRREKREDISRRGKPDEIENGDLSEAGNVKKRKGALSRDREMGRRAEEIEEYGMDAREGKRRWKKIQNAQWDDVGGRSAGTESGEDFRRKMDGEREVRRKKTKDAESSIGGKNKIDRMDRGKEVITRRGKKSYRSTSRLDEEENRDRKMHGVDGEEKVTGRRRRKLERDNAEKEEMMPMGDEEKATGRRGRRKLRKDTDEEDTMHSEDEEKATGRRGRRKLGKDTQEEEMMRRDDKDKASGRRGRRKLRKDAEEEDEMHTDDEEIANGRRRKKIEADNAGKEEMADPSKSKAFRKERKKKADVLDSERRGVSYGADEEREVLKGDGKRKGRSSALREGTDDSELTKKRKAGKKEIATSTEDKSTLDSGDRKKKEASVASKKGSRLLDSSRTVDDDYSKINGSRYQRRKPGVSKLHDVEIDPPNSIEYQLSDRHFVELGWTVLPVTRTMRKIVLYEARTAKPHLDWFKRVTYEDCIYYKDGMTPFANFRQDGTGEVFYPNGKLAVRVYTPTDRKYDMYTVFTPGGKDSVGIKRESQIVALFDSIGNGAVFDENGATRLSYNQIGGICTDNPAGAPFAWTWDGETKESIVKTVYVEKVAPRLEKLLQTARDATTKSSGSVKPSTSPSSWRSKDKKVVERKPVTEEYEEEVESGSDFTRDYPKKTCHVQIVCMKLNEYLSLRILDRRDINLQFLAGAKSIRIELGTVLDLNKKMASYFVDSNSKTDMLKCKFETISSPLKPESSLYELAKEFREIKRTVKQRKKIIAKYRPFSIIEKI